MYSLLPLNKTGFGVRGAMEEPTDLMIQCMVRALDHDCEVTFRSTTPDIRNNHKNLHRRRHLYSKIFVPSTSSSNHPPTASNPSPQSLSTASKANQINLNCSTDVSFIESEFKH